MSLDWDRQKEPVLRKRETGEEVVDYQHFNHPPGSSKIMKRKAPKKQKSDVTLFTSEIITRGMIDQLDGRKAM